MMENTCVKLYSNANVGVMLWTSSLCANFNIWPSSVTLTLDLPEPMFWNGTPTHDNKQLCQAILWSIKAGHKLLWTDAGQMNGRTTPNNIDSAYRQRIKKESKQIFPATLFSKCTFFNSLYRTALTKTWRKLQNIPRYFTVHRTGGREFWRLHAISCGTAGVREQIWVLIGSNTSTLCNKYTENFYNKSTACMCQQSAINAWFQWEF